jgi:predicted nucleotidyltransferase
MEFTECICDRIKKEEGLASEIHSLILFGSYVRGDFVEGVSDLDFFAVLTGDPEEILPKLTPIVEECTSGIDKVLLDLPWSHLSEIYDPLNKGFPFKFLTIYQDDFLENHVIVHGKGIEDILPRYDRKELFSWRAERLLNSLERFKDKTDMLRISAGEVIRLMTLMNGAKSISKDDIHATLGRIGDEEALDIFEAYLDGRNLERSNDYWVEFITSRIRKSMKGRNEHPELSSYATSL